MDASEARSTERILLVDDDATNLQMLFRTLSGLGHRLLVAKSGEAALTIAREACPELVLLDIMMPGMDGFEVCERLKADPATRDTPIIFLSAMDGTEDKVRGLELGAVDYVAKPFEPAEVVARVNTHMTVHRLQRQLEQANRRMKRDLDAAAAIQHALLPRAAPENANLHFAWRYRPCDELAGDSLNLFRIDDHHIGMYVLDVSGHGVPAALLSVAVTRSLTPRFDASCLVTAAPAPGLPFTAADPVGVVRRLNSLYPMDSENALYFTILYGVIHLRERVLRYVAAGHPGPLLLRADESFEIMDSTGVPVGILADEEAFFEAASIALTPGDRLYVFSDGLYEERDPGSRMFGLDRLRDQAVLRRDQSLEQAIDALVQDVIDWRGNRQLSDDVAVLGFDVLPA